MLPAAEPDAMNDEQGFRTGAWLCFLALAIVFGSVAGAMISLPPFDLAAVGYMLGIAGVSALLAIAVRP